MRLPPETAWRAAAGLAAVAAVGVALWLAYALRAVLLPFALAVVLTYVIEPAVRALCARGLSRRAAILGVYAGVAALVAAGVVYLVPAFLAELDQFGRVAPRLAARLQAWIHRIQADYDRVPLPPTLRAAVDDAVTRAGQGLRDGIAGLVEGLMRGAAAAAAALLAPFLAYYMLNDLDLFKRRLLGMVPARWRPRVLAVLRDLDAVIGGFVRGQVVVAALIGSAVGVVAAMLGMPFPLLLGLLAAFGEFVPYFGPVIGSLPAVAVAALQSPGTLIRLVLFLIVIHELEQAVLTPRILGVGVRLHPLTVVFALLVGGHVLGLFGLIVAVPVAATLRVVGVHLAAELMPRRLPGLEAGGNGRAEAVGPVPAGAAVRAGADGEPEETAGERPSRGR